MKRPLAHIGFSIAVTLLILNLIDFKYVFVISIGLAVIFAASLVLSKFRKALSVPLCIGGALIGCLIFACNLCANVNPQFSLDDKTYNSEFYIIDLAQKNGDKYDYTIKTRKIDCENAPQNIKLKLRTDHKLVADEYQIMSGKLKFNKISNNAFDSYGSWADNVFLSAKCYDCDVKDERINSLNKYVLNVRKDIIKSINTLLNGDNGGLATALLIGDKSNLSKHVYNDFKIAGVTHIMAVSGMHLVVLSSVFIFLFKKVGINKRIRAAIIIPLVLFYIALAGFSKSVMRAGIIMLVLLIGELFKRKADSLNSLGLAVLILCFNPFVITDVGAMLSVLSTMSLITLYPHFNQRIVKNKYLNKPIIRQIISSISISICVMLFTLPVMYIFFGYVSVASVISNIILVPIGSICMVSSLLLYLSSFIPFLSPLFVWFANGITSFMLFLVKHLANLPYAIMPLNEYSYIVFAAALIIVGVSFMTNRKKNIRFATLLVGFIIMFNVFSPLTLVDNNDKIMVCKNNAVLIQCKGEVLVTCLKDYDDYYVISDYIFKNNLKCDTIVLSNDYDNNKYNVMLSRKFVPDNIVSFGDMKSLYEMPKTNIINYEEQYYFNDYIVYNSLDNKGNYFDLKAKDFTISNSRYSDSDVVINKNYIEDCNGYIDLSQSNVVYCLNSDNTFTVRRVD